MLAWTFGIFKVVRINHESVEDICEASSNVGIHEDALLVGQMLVMQIVFIFNIEFILSSVL